MTSKDDYENIWMALILFLIFCIWPGEEKGGESDHFMEETYQDVPPLVVIKSNNNLVFKPNLAANAIASAADAIWTPASNWLTIFIPLENKIDQNDVIH